MKTALALLICCPLLTAPAQAFDWTGFYAGVGIGGMSAGYEDGSGLNVSQGATSLEGFAGFRIEALMLTLGAEVDAAYRLPVGSEGGPTGIGKASARATVGMELGPLMPFVSGGVALSRQDGSSGVAEESYTGLIVGAGVDLGVTENIFARVEASYSVFAQGDDPMAPSLAALTSETNLRAGLGWRF